GHALREHDRYRRAPRERRPEFTCQSYLSVGLGAVPRFPKMVAGDGVWRGAGVAGDFVYSAAPLDRRGHRHCADRAGSFLVAAAGAWQREGVRGDRSAGKTSGVGGPGAPLAVAVVAPGGLHELAV